MSSRQEHKFYTIEEANQLIVRLRPLIIQIRHLRDALIREQDKSDIEELTRADASGKMTSKSKSDLEKCHRKIKFIERSIKKRLKIFDDLGCQLKSLDPGLVDFFSEKNGEIIFLCWEEAEETVGYWHSLEGGYATRSPIE